MESILSSLGRSFTSPRVGLVQIAILSNDGQDDGDDSSSLLGRFSTLRFPEVTYLGKC